MVGTVFIIGDELMSGGWAPWVPSFATSHVLVDEILGLSSSGQGGIGFRFICIHSLLFCAWKVFLISCTSLSNLLFVVCWPPSRPLSVRLIMLTNVLRIFTFFLALFRIIFISFFIASILPLRISTSGSGWCSSWFVF